MADPEADAALEEADDDEEEDDEDRAEEEEEGADDAGDADDAASAADRRKLSARSRRRHAATLAASLNQGVRRGVARVGPWQGRTPPRRRRRPARVGRLQVCAAAARQAAARRGERARAIYLATLLTLSSLPRSVNYNVPDAAGQLQVSPATMP
jgi:hypothetical protein